ncbi:MAG: TIGR01777 family oxidoreductase [Polyangiaceae bacterium]
MASSSGGSVPSPSLTILIAGASGLVGRALVAHLTEGGHRVVRLVRRDPTQPNELRWDPSRGEIDRAGLEGADAIVNLAGENVGDGRWSKARRAAILESRIASTGLLARAAAELTRRPRVFVSASGVGIYGLERDQPADETAPVGGGFLAEVCAAWEAAAEPARSAKIRTVAMRLGVVLSKEGGALAKMLPAFKLGAGGPIGGGRQWLSWISMRDAVRAFARAIDDPRLAGPVNVVAPEPVMQRDFAMTLGRVLKKPVGLPVPRLAITAMFGEMGRETVLASQRAMPKKLLDVGFRFDHPSLLTALEAELPRS